MRGRPLLDALFAVTLRAYPRAFRRRFGDEMRADFARRPSWRQLPSLFAGGIAERRTAVARALLAPAHTPHLYGSSGRFAMWDVALGDVRHAIRMSTRSPLYTLLAVLALGLGIGVNTAIFTVVNSVLLKPLPYRSAGDLVMLWSDDRLGKKSRNPLSPADFADFQRQIRPLVTLEGCFSFVTNSRLTVDGQSEIAATEAVTPGMFALLGRDAVLGRTLSDADPDERIVLSDGFWRRRFGADPRVLGRKVDLDGRPFTVAGVMPADFVFPYKGMLGPTGFTRTLEVDFWAPLRVTAPPFTTPSGQMVRNVRFLSAVGRLQPGVTIEQARGAIATAAADLAQAYPDSNKGWATTVVPLHEQVVGEIRPALLLLAGGVALILLMACVNVASLVLARSVARRKEMAVRAALGATPRRLAVQALTESLLLAVAGVVVALLFVSWGVPALVALAPDNLPRLHEVRPDLSVLASALAIGVVAGLLVGLVPAAVTGTADVHEALADAGRGAIGSKHRLRSSLVVAEIALALVLAIGAGLLLRSFDKLLAVDPGFRVDHLLTLQMNIPERLTTAVARRAFYATFFERLEALPGVVSAGGTTRIPLGSTSVSTSIEVEGRAVPVGERPTVEFRRALRDYFTTMGIPVIRGRGFTAGDTPTSPSVAVINEAAARRLFANEDPIGRHVRLGPSSSGPWSTIVGVVGDVRHSRLEDEPEPELYVSAVQNPPVSPFVVVRTAGDPAELAELLRAAARAIDPTLTLYDIRTMQQIRSTSVAERRFVLVLIGAFGLLALALAGVGVYGVMSLVVSERTQEVGVRIALGAEPTKVLGMIVRDAVGLALIGVGVGLALAAALSPLIASQLFGVRAADAVTLLVTPAVLIAAAALAALVPGWRAMRIDPIRAINSP